MPESEVMLVFSAQSYEVYRIKFKMRVFPERYYMMYCGLVFGTAYSAFRMPFKVFFTYFRPPRRPG